jgi:CTP synthase (UTP-ammonia lyase)
VTAECRWLHTSQLRPIERTLDGVDALWCVPASPYADTDAALDAIRHARETGLPFLGTCGGFQHAVLEYARNVLGLESAAHAELSPAATEPVIAPLACSLVERTASIAFLPGSRTARAYGTLETREEYHCRYGLATHFEPMLRSGPLRITGRDAAGEARVVELDGHPFFVATLFQSERRALRGETPPLVRAFIEAARGPRSEEPGNERQFRTSDR